MCDFKDVLVGKTLKNIKISDNKQAVLFITDEIEVAGLCNDDCSSETWIEHIKMPSAGLPALVLDVEELELPRNDEYLKFYGLKIITYKGEIFVDYRNESEGYEDGYLVLIDEDNAYNGRYSVTNANWIDVASDL